MNKSTKNIAVYIDGDNVSYKHLSCILKEIKSYGRIIISRVYADWSKENTKGWNQTALQNGINLVQCVRVSNKNSSDIKLCIDIMKDLYTKSHIDIFYIVTSDSDYRHIMQEIKDFGRIVHCIGNDDANIALRSNSDKYTKLSVIHKDTKKKQRKKLPKVMVRQFKEEIDILLDDTPDVNIGWVKECLSRKYQFDYREWGFSKMSDFLSGLFSQHYKKSKEGSSICRR